MLELSTDTVARYYDRNIQRFLRLGGSGHLAAIHRQVWAPGVESAAQAFAYTNHLAAKSIQPALKPGSAHVLDVGCGAGGTSTWLVEKLGVCVTGIANGAAQIALARQRAARLGLAGQCHFLHADFHCLPDLPPAQAAVAIESFVHAQDAGHFFDQVVRRLEPGGRLVVIDDFLTPLGQQDSRADFWVQRFCQGWYVRSLLSLDQAQKLAERAGFRLVARHDLSAYLRTIAWPVLAGMLLASALPVSSDYLDNWRGGSALQVCLKRGWSGYYVLVWEKM